MARSVGAQAQTARPPSPLPKQNHVDSRVPARKPDDYTSEGVDDNDVFLLPVSDYQVMLGMTILGAIVRLFRIYQPSSVVFDEVQYVALCYILPSIMSLANDCLSQLRRLRFEIH